MDAATMQKEEVSSLARIILEILGCDKIPEIELTYDKVNGFCVEKNLIRIKMPFKLDDLGCVCCVAHECYHFYDFVDIDKKTYSEEDRFIIENVLSEYEYKYSFERDAEVFSYAFANYFIKNVVGYNYREAIPYITSEAKAKFPELTCFENEMKKEYQAKKDNYFKKFDKYKDKLIYFYKKSFDI